MYQKIMVAVDGSPSSQRAVEEAARIAKLTHGHVRSVYVLDWAPVFPYTCYYDLASRQRGRAVSALLDVSRPAGARRALTCVHGTRRWAKCTVSSGAAAVLCERRRIVVADRQRAIDLDMATGACVAQRDDDVVEPAMATAAAIAKAESGGVRRDRWAWA